MKSDISYQDLQDLDFEGASAMARAAENGLGSGQLIGLESMFAEVQCLAHSS